MEDITESKGTLSMVVTRTAPKQGGHIRCQSALRVRGLPLVDLRLLRGSELDLELVAQRVQAALGLQ